MGKSFSEKTIVILGGSSGIGLATAKMAIEEGARVVITARSRERLEAAQSALGESAKGIALDASDEAGTRALFSEIPRVDHIFVNAGSVVSDAALTKDVAAFRAAIDVRFWGAVYAAKYGVAKMHGEGSLVFMSGTSAVRPIPGAAIGSASCAAVEGLAGSLAVDLAPIRVNAVRPGLIDTPLIDRFAGANKAAFVENFAKRLPVKRMGNAEEIADAVLFLMRNGYVTGITLPVDGGARLA